jgi:para-aminobenzoate synthetase/4-amino-4-deoxychorismate lyase
MKDLGQIHCTILLDDAQSSIHHPTSRFYNNPLRHIKSLSEADLHKALEEIQKALNKNQHVVACFSYELGEYLVGLTPKPSKTPWIEAWVFDNFQKLSFEETNQWINEELSQNSFIDDVGILNIHNSVSSEKFKSKIDEIQEFIRDGDTYQVNYTYRIHGRCIGSPLSLYKKLRQIQPVPFGAYIEHQYGSILSCSPEWFLSKTGQILKTKPMKGTGHIAQVTPTDLHNDPKNRAENLMIVDLLRNDLGKISISGTVKVPELFSVSQYGDVLQMTSTIESTAQENINLFDLLKAIFPCGSVTGAPKIKTMEIIQNLEHEPLQLYCGAIAWLEPSESGDGLGDIGMSVVIRTLEIDSQQDFSMGVGAGITIDSNRDEEWEECQIKSHFLNQLSQNIGLFETIRIENQNPLNLDLHIKRLLKSAKVLGIPINESQVIYEIELACKDINHSPQRMRLDLSHVGDVQIQVAALNELRSHNELIWAKDLGVNEIMYSNNLLLNHKVNSRTSYDLAWKRAEEAGSFDAIFTNEKEEVTEGGRSNIFIKKNGIWITPPISSGCLPGVMRSIILKDPKWNAIEKSISIEDVKSADKIILTNALRGIISINQ